MLLHKTDLKHQQHSQESISKRPRILMNEPSTTTTTNITSLVDRLNPSASIMNWQTTSLKNYEESSGWPLFIYNFEDKSICFLF
jgi:hypothetical protein